MKSKIWNLEEDNKLKELVLSSNYAYIDIAKILNKTKQQCKGRAKILNLENKFIYRKYFHNENFWSAPNKLNSFWAGFGIADACLVDREDGKYSYSIQISEMDKDYLQEFANNIEYTGKLSFINSIKKTTNKISKLVSLRIHSRQWGQDLIKNFNLTPRKTFTVKPPNLNESLLFYYLKGLIDGDGCIAFSSKKGITIRICGASKDLIYWVRDFCEKHFGHFNIKGTKKNNIYEYNQYYTFTIAGIRGCFLFDFLRKLKTPILARKWERPEVIEWVEKHIKKYNDLITKTQYNNINMKAKLKKATGKVQSTPVANNPVETKKYTNIYQMLGDNGVQKYGTLDPVVYRNKLESFNESDLTEEAEKYGYKHIHTREITINYLMGEFYNHTHTFSDSFGKITPNVSNSNIKDEKLKNILRAAR